MLKQLKLGGAVLAGAALSGVPIRTAPMTGSANLIDFDNICVLSG